MSAPRCARCGRLGIASTWIVVIDRGQAAAHYHRRCYRDTLDDARGGRVIHKRVLIIRKRPPAEAIAKIRGRDKLPP